MNNVFILCPFDKMVGKTESFNNLSYQLLQVVHALSTTTKVRAYSNYFVYVDELYAKYDYHQMVRKSVDQIIDNKCLVIKEHLWPMTKMMKDILDAVESELGDKVEVLEINTIPKGINAMLSATSDSSHDDDSEDDDDDE